MSTPVAIVSLEQLRAVNAASPFNAWAGFELLSSGAGCAELALRNRPELQQHSGFLHAGVSAALIDTAAGYAAASVRGPVLSSQIQVTPYRPAVGDNFVARAVVARAGSRQIFVNVEMFARSGQDEELVAGGSAIFITVT